MSLLSPESEAQEKPQLRTIVSPSSPVILEELINDRGLKHGSHNRGGYSRPAVFVQRTSKPLAEWY